MDVASAIYAQAGQNQTSSPNILKHVSNNGKIFQAGSYETLRQGLENDTRKPEPIVLSNSLAPKAEREAQAVEREYQGVEREYQGVEREYQVPGIFQDGSGPPTTSNYPEASRDPYSYS